MQSVFTLIIQEARAIQCVGCTPLICGKNKGLVLCSGSKATKKFQKHICFSLFCLLYSLYLTSQQFKYTFPTQLFTQWIRWVFVDHLLCARLGAGNAERRQSEQWEEMDA